MSRLNKENIMFYLSKHGSSISQCVNILALIYMINLYYNLKRDLLNVENNLVDKVLILTDSFKSLLKNSTVELTEKLNLQEVTLRKQSEGLETLREHIQKTNDNISVISQNFKHKLELQSDIVHALNKTQPVTVVHDGSGKYALIGAVLVVGMLVAGWYVVTPHAVTFSQKSFALANYAISEFIKALPWNNEINQTVTYVMAKVRIKTEVLNGVLKHTVTTLNYDGTSEIMPLEDYLVMLMQQDAVLRTVALTSKITPNGIDFTGL